MNPEGNKECSPFLEKALLNFFAYTTVSSAIIETLEGSDTLSGDEEILSSVRDIRRLEIPRTAVESSLLILADSGLLVSSQGSYRLTDGGKELAAKLAGLRMKLQ